MITQQAKQIRLAAWSELVGTYEGFVIDGHYIHVKIDDNVISFGIESEEAKFLQQILKNTIIGTKIGILKTGLPSKPLLIRLISQQSARNMKTLTNQTLPTTPNTEFCKGKKKNGKKDSQHPLLSYETQD